MTEKKGFLEKIFNFFKTEIPKEEPILEESKVIETPPARPLKEKQECFYCNTWIEEGDRWSKQANKWFHRKCYKDFLRSGRQGKLVNK